MKQADHSGRCPLHWAAVYAFMDVVEVLLKEGKFTSIENPIVNFAKLNIVTFDSN